MNVYEKFPAAGVKCCLMMLLRVFGRLNQFDLAEEQGWQLKSLNEALGFLRALAEEFEVVLEFHLPEYFLFWLTDVEVVLEFRLGEDYLFW